MNRNVFTPRELESIASFHGALNGAFTPDIDPERRQHCVRWLAMATRKKGRKEAPTPREYEEIFGTAHELRVRRYAPSWAIGTDLSVFTDRREGNERIIAGVVLNSDSEVGCATIQLAEMSDKGSGLLLVNGTGFEIYPHMEVKELAAVQSAISGAVVHFYNAVHQQQLMLTDQSLRV